MFFIFFILLPFNRAELFNHPINWDLIEENHIVPKFLHEWIVKKTKEYLGEEVESLTNFLMAQLGARCKPQALLEELSTVLDEDSDNFMLKLWRMLVYYSLKCELESN
jgi:RNA-binding protein 25